MFKHTIFVLICILMLLTIIFPASAYADPVLPGRVLSVGSQGIDVIKLQEALRQLGYSIKADGIYGQQTQNAVLDFQKKYAELPDDGVYGLRTGEFMRILLMESQLSEGEQGSSEANVNEDLNEDKALTYNAGTAGLVYRLPQRFVNENHDRLIQTAGAYTVKKVFKTLLPESIKENIQ